jgi:hypothetical protein
LSSECSTDPNTKIDNEWFENMAELKYWGPRERHQNYNYEEI